MVCDDKERHLHRKEAMTGEKNVIIGSKVKLRDKRLADALEDYSWQSDPELAQLDAAPVLIATFPQYLSDYADNLRRHQSTRRRFAVETLDGKHIGNCGYYGIDEIRGEVEVGIMIGNRDYWNKGYGTDIISTLVGYIFLHTNLKRIHLKTLISNVRAQKCFKKCGFTAYRNVVRDGFSFMLMEISRKQWKE